MRAANAVDVVRHPRVVAALTPGETRYLAEYAVHGDQRRVAECLGRSVSTVKNSLRDIHAKTGTTSSVEAMYRLGWIKVSHP